MFYFILLATTLPATTYGYGEIRCGDVGHAEACSTGAVTASGEPFDPDAVAAAIPLPQRRIMRPFDLSLRARDGSCVLVRVNDKSHPRWIGQRGLDLTPGALRALGHEPSATWGGEVQLC